jgi:hypothetical protein
MHHPGQARGFGIVLTGDHSGLWGESDFIFTGILIIDLGFGNELFTAGK